MKRIILCSNNKVWDSQDGEALLAWLDIHGQLTMNDEAFATDEVVKQFVEKAGVIFKDEERAPYHIISYTDEEMVALIGNLVDK